MEVPMSITKHTFSVRWMEDKKQYYRKYCQKYINDYTECECGKKYNRFNKARHLKSNYHLKRVDKNIDIKML